MSEKTLIKKSKAIGYTLAVLAHAALIAVILFSAHDNKDKEKLIPVAVTVLDEPAEPTGEMVIQAKPQPLEPEPPQPEPVIEPEPPQPEASVAIVKEEEKKPEPPKKKEEEPKKKEPEKPQKPTMADRMRDAKKNTQPKQDKPKQRKVSSKDLYKPQTPSGKAAIKGTTVSDGISTDQANAQQLYFSIVCTKMNQLWNTYGPNELSTVPTSVFVSFNVTSTGMVTSFKIIRPSNSPAMNTAAKELEQHLKTDRFKSYSESGIKGLGTVPFIMESFELKYQNQ